MLVRLFLCGLWILVFLLTGHAAITVEAYLHNVPADWITVKYPYQKPPDVFELKPTLALYGKGNPKEEFQLLYRLEKQVQVLFQDEVKISAPDGWFEAQVELKQNFPGAESVAWELVVPGRTSEKGVSALAWSRFHGSVRYYDPQLEQSTYLHLIPVAWGSPCLE